MFENAKWAKNQEEINRSLGQFLFLFFIPNPYMRTVQCWIDDGEITFVEEIDKFLDIIKLTLSDQELSKVRKACTEYGTPFLYNRVEQKLHQLYEKVDEKRMNFFEDMKKKVSLPKDSETFESLKKDLEHIRDIKSISTSSISQ